MGASSSLMNKTELSIWTFVVALFGLLAIAANLSVLVAFFSQKCLRRSPSNYFAINLTISDICVVVGPMPLWLLNMWHIHSRLSFKERGVIPVNKLHRYTIAWQALDSVLVNVSVCSLAFLSIERCIAATKPLFHRRHISKKLMANACLFPWFYAFAALSPTMVLKDTLHILTCKVVVISIPCLVIIAAYTVLLKEIRSMSKRFRAADGAFPCTRSSVMRRKRNMNLALRSSLLTIAFLLCWLPYVSWAIWCVNPGNYSSLRPSTFMHITMPIKFLSYFNSLLNPFLYVMGRPAFLLVFKEALCKSSYKKYVRRRMQQTAFPSAVVATQHTF